MSSLCSAACLARTAMSSFSCGMSASHSLRMVRRSSRATWSFRERDVWRRLPAEPMRSVRVCSTKVWMSSAFGSISRAPDSRSSRMPCSPARMASVSSFELMPCAPSMVAWAMDPVMSSLYIRESNLMLELKSLVFGSISFENRPVQSFIGGKTSYSLSSSLYA